MAIIMIGRTIFVFFSIKTGKNSSFRSSITIMEVTKTIFLVFLEILAQKRLFLVSKATNVTQSLEIRLSVFREDGRKIKNEPFGPAID